MTLLAAVQADPPRPPASVPSTSQGVYWLMLLLAAVFVAVVLPRLRRKRPAEQSLGTFGSSTGGAREELERLLTEIQDLSREHIARLDTKIRMLNQLLLECDQKKRELEALLGAAPAAKAPGGRPANPLHDQVYALKDAGKDLLEICAATGLEKGEVDLILGLRGMPPRKT